MALLEGGRIMMNRIDLEFEQAIERRREDLAKAEHARLVAACSPSIGLARRAARLLGRVFFSLGARLLSYADTRRSSSALPAYHHSSRSIELH
jgi:hypothetical protein